MGGRKVSTILSGDLKLVSSLKEVVPHTEEEIYAMLKECNKDPDETVQRLLKEDKFHIVKRRRDKKKENSGNVKNASECQLSGGAGNFSRSKRSSGAPDNQGTGKGNSSLRRNTSEQFGVRNKMENGAVFSTKASIPILGGNLSYSQLGQDSAFSKSLLPIQDTNGRSEASANIEEIYAVGPVSGHSSVLQGAWRVRSGRGTLAEMLKMSIIPDRQKSMSTTQETISGMVDPTSLEQHSGQNVSPSLMNPAFNSSMGSFPQSYSSVVKEESNNTDRSSMGYHESNLVEHTHENIRVSPFSLERDAVVLPLPPTNTTHSESREQIPELSNNERYLTGIAEAQKLPDIVTEHTTASLYQENHSMEAKKDSKSDCAHSQEDLSLDNHSPHSRDIGILSVATSKLKQLNLHDKHSVIIPEHIRIQEADCPMLSFGSFNACFENSAAGFNTEEAIHFPVSEGVTKDGLSVTTKCEAGSWTSTSTTDILDQEQQIGSGTLLQENERMTDSSDTTEEVLSEKASNTSCPESFPEVHIITSNDDSKYTAKSNSLENSTSMQPVDGSTYYSGVFQQDSDVDARYSSFLQGGAFHKVDSINGHAEASGLNTISREVNNDATVPISNITGGGNTAPSVDFIPSAAEAALEHSPSILAHATTQPVGPYANVFDYQYMASGFSYLQSPYQHNCVGVGTYQVPSPAISDAGMKYSLTQYSSKMNNKATGVNNVIAPGGLGYGVGYSNPQAGSFPGNPSVTTGNATSFEDTVPQQFKDICNVQNPSQQMEGSSVWLQNQLTREGQGNNNLYYNLAASQNQQLRYAQAQSSLLANNGHHQPALYSYPYHSQHEQSGSSSTVQQLLQQHVLAPLGQSLLSNAYQAAPYCNLYQTQQSSSNSTLQQQLLLQQHQHLGTLGTQSGQAQQRAHTTWPNLNSY